MPDTAGRIHGLQDKMAAVHAELQAALAPQVARKDRFLYDEWDHLIHDYRRHWCQLEETVLDDAGTSFVTRHGNGMPNC